VGELVEAYAAGALDDAERERFRAHLAACPRCRADAAAYAEVVSGLPAALAAAAPAQVPAGLRERVLRAALEGRPPTPAARRPGPPWPRAARRGARRAAALAAAVAVALAAGWGVQQGVALARERAQLRAEYAALVGQQETVLEVVDGRNTVRRLLAPPGGGGPGAPYGKLYTRPDLPQVVAMAGRLPPPPPGQAYHLWVAPPGPEGPPRLAGVLAFNQGFGLLVFDAPEPGPAYTAAWITVQAPGAGGPAGPTVLRWPDG
jgi:hypothetical protein